MRNLAEAQKSGASLPVPGELSTPIELRRTAELGALLRRMDETARAVYDALPSGSLLVMPTLQGNAKLVRDWHKQRAQMTAHGQWSPLHENGLQAICTQARSALVFLAIKE